MKSKRFAFKTACTILTVAILLPLTEVLAKDFNLKKGNAAVEVVIPTIAPVIFTDVSPSGGDATLGLVTMPSTI